MIVCISIYRALKSLSPNRHFGSFCRVTTTFFSTTYQWQNVAFWKRNYYQSTNGNFCVIAIHPRFLASVVRKIESKFWNNPKAQTVQAFFSDCRVVALWFFRALPYTNKSHGLIESGIFLQRSFAWFYSKHLDKKLLCSSPYYAFLNRGDAFCNASPQELPMFRASPPTIFFAPGRKKAWQDKFCFVYCS